MIPKNITKEHLEKAIKEIDNEGIRKGRHSSTYDLFHKNKAYPPKLVISIANRHANGIELNPNDFEGGKETAAFEILKIEGFTIKRKVKPSISLYTILMKAKSNFENAGFKYKAIRENSRYVWVEDENNIIGRKPAHYEFISRRGSLYLELHFEETKSKALFHQQIKNLPSELEWINWDGSKSIRYKKSYQLDNDNISLNIVDDLIEFDKLIGDRIRSILINQSRKYWIYAPGEKARKWNEFYEQNILAIGWDEIGDLSQYKSKNMIADKLRKVNNEIGTKKNDSLACFEFASVMKPGDIIIAKKGKREYLGWGIINGKYFFDNSKNEFKNRRSINWKSKGEWTDEEGDIALKTLTDITKYPDYVKRLSKILKIEISKNVNDLTKIPINAKVIYSYLKNSLSHRKIQKEVLGKEAPTNGGGFLAMEILHEYNIGVDKKGILNKISFDFEYNKASGQYLKALKLLKEHYDEFKNNQTNIHKMDFPLNTILYGPPGTGKTYNTILRAAQIIENRVIDSYDEALEVFKSNLHDKIEFITFHQNYSYEDFIQGLRPDTENDNQLTFERKDGVFKEIADKALKNLIESEKPQLSKRLFEEVFNEFINPLVEGEIEEIEVKMKKVSYFITAISNKSIDFRKASGGTAHTLSIGTLKKMYLAESVLEIQGLASYYSPLLAELLKLGKDSSGKKEQIKRQDYVIIIDEINRANISRVFGELITLIEPDKRSHGSIPLEARLPSGDPFIVPSNLFIIGTMNTADKSIALLDIALRRRFEFESMYPKYEIEGQEIYDVEILEKINKQIIKSKGHDFQIGHAYFMGDNKDLLQRMNKKIIPLLLEYYMNDEKEVKGILNSAGLIIEENSWPLKISGKID